MHGETHAMAQLRSALLSDSTHRIPPDTLHCPKNAEKLCLTFDRHIKAQVSHSVRCTVQVLNLAKAIGSLAREPPQNNQMCEGMLVSSSDSTYQIVDVADLQEVGLQSTEIMQEQRIMRSVNWDSLRWQIQNLFTDVEDVQDSLQPGVLAIYRVCDTSKRL